MECENENSELLGRACDSRLALHSLNPENEIENASHDDCLEENNVTHSEIDVENESVTSVEEPKELGTPLSNCRQIISKQYLDGEGLVETKFSAHFKKPIPRYDEINSGGFDMYFAATLPFHNQEEDVLLIQSGDYFTDYVFMACIQAAKDVDLLFMFLKISWLDKCPPEQDSESSREGMPVEVPTLESDEWILISRKEVLEGSSFPPLRTGILNASSRRLLFMKLLHQMIVSADLWVQVSASMEGQDLSLRPVVDLTKKTDDDADINSTAGDGDGDEDGGQLLSQNGSSVTEGKRNPINDAAVSDKGKGKGKSKSKVNKPLSRGAEKQNIALRQIQDFGNNMFPTSTGTTTRNAEGGVSKSVVVKSTAPSKQPKVTAAAKTKQPSPKRKSPPLQQSQQQVIKKATTPKGNQVASCTAAVIGRGGKVQRSAVGSSTTASSKPSVAEQRMLDEIARREKEWKKDQEEAKRERERDREQAKRDREQAKRDREELKREREEFEQAKKQEAQSQQQQNFRSDDDEHDDIAPSPVQRRGRKVPRNGAGGQLDASSTTHHQPPPYRAATAQHQQQQQSVVVQQQMDSQHQPPPPNALIPQVNFPNSGSMQLDPTYMAFIGTSYLGLCMAYSNQKQR